MRLRLRHRVLAVLLLCFASSIARPASAAPDDDPRKVQAEAIFKEGVRLHAQGRNDDALAKLNEAFGIYPSPNTLAGIARVEHAMGKKLEAIRHYREALRNPLIHPENAAWAKKGIAELEPSLARIEVTGPKGLAVMIEGREQILPLADNLDVAADTIRLSGMLGNVRYEGVATAVVGRVTTIEMKAVAQTTNTNAGSNGDHVVVPPREEPSFWTTGHTVGVIAWGASAVAGTAGILFTLGANDASDRIDAARARSPNPDSSCAGVVSVACDERREADEDRARNTNLAIGSFVAGSVLLVGGAVAFLFWSSPQTKAATVKRPRLLPAISHQGGALLFQQGF